MVIAAVHGVAAADVRHARVLGVNQSYFRTRKYPRMQSDDRRHS